MISKTTVVLGALIGLVAFGKAQAEPITYTFSATGSGSLGPNPFSNASVTLTATSDSSMVTMEEPGLFVVPNLTATVSVSGLGAAAFTIPTSTFDNQATSAAGINGLSFVFPDILDLLNPALATYDLTTSIGPLTGPALFNPGRRFPTTSGDFVLNSVSSNVTFQAILVPEPSSLALLGLGTAALAG